jgi:hypothetical protein
MHLKLANLMQWLMAKGPYKLLPPQILLYVSEN